VTTGIVSAEGRDIGYGPYNDFIQIDAPTNQGSPGGPTFDLAGNVIGVNTALWRTPGAAGFIGIAFAIPADTVKSIIAELKRERRRDARLARRRGRAGDAGNCRAIRPEHATALRAGGAAKARRRPMARSMCAT
jgi:S1-C subfamily serine protease